MAPAKKKQRLSNGSAAPVEAVHGDSEPQEAKEKAAEKPDQRRSLFVRSLPPNATSESLTELFSESYPVKHATAVIDSATKQCRGYGFVTFADAEDAERARAEFNGHTLDGRKLRVELAEPRQRDAEKKGKDPAAVVKSQRQQDIPQPSRLIVRNLPWTVKSSDDLGKLFLSYGKVKQAYIPKQKNGLLAGFGFVVLRGRKNAEKALEGVNGKEVDGRTLAVDWAVSKGEYEKLLKKGGDADEDADEDGVEKADEGQDVDGEDEHSDESEIDGDDAEKVPGESDGFEDFDEDADVDVDMNDDEEAETDGDKSEDRSSTLFVRNLPFTCTDEDLEDHFSAFGATRYARVVMDAITGRSKGTGFVCFYNKPDADACIRAAPRRTLPATPNDAKDSKTLQAPNSILQNEDADPSGQYTMDGRVLQVSQALDKSSADRLTQEGAAHRHKSKEDKRRLYLLSEGTISTKSKLYEKLSPSERNMREASAKQRKQLIESNPSLHLSLTRLSIRNIPRSIGSKELKALAREAVVGFATDVKASTREPLSKEELSRGGEEMQEAEKARKKAGKGVVKQAKVVFEGQGGSKVSEDTGAGKSRGYGFIEYYTHRNALMGLRWLNGHAVGYQVKDNSKAKAAAKEEIQDRKKRLIVEFAIENAQVVMRRKDNEVKARERSKAVERGELPLHQPVEGEEDSGSRKKKKKGSLKRKRDDERSEDSTKRPRRPRENGSEKGKPGRQRDRFGMIRRGTGKGVEGDKGDKAVPNGGAEKKEKKVVDEKLVKRNQIIGRKRAMRKNRAGGSK
ncbi:RNA recognition motif-containing protein [Saxophila tyrrhenica]|uniref:RNA recognition motif-containing protein n=1 Tax=Saxophila tyrrhenica TaxID=1690608 RepID=A0AAV9P6W7_9PEZI|nr:RNA recognition motif-containing protein [Saxophila tyrrhenica]